MECIGWIGGSPLKELPVCDALGEMSRRRHHQPLCSQTGSPEGPELSDLPHSNIIVGFHDWISRPFVPHFLWRHPFTQKKPCSPLDCPWLNGRSFHDFQWKLVSTVKATSGSMFELLELDVNVNGTIINNKPACAHTTIHLLPATRGETPRTRSTAVQRPTWNQLHRHNNGEATTELDWHRRVRGRYSSRTIFYSQ